MQLIIVSLAESFVLTQRKANRSLARPVNMSLRRLSDSAAGNVAGRKSPMDCPLFAQLAWRALRFWWHQLFWHHISASDIGQLHL
jgi:hypothetical protein